MSEMECGQAAGYSINYYNELEGLCESPLTCQSSELPGNQSVAPFSRVRAVKIATLDYIGIPLAVFGCSGSPGARPGTDAGLSLDGAGLDGNSQDCTITVGTKILLCNADEDDDGVSNRNDHCPFEAGLEKLMGCLQDCISTDSSISLDCSATEFDISQENNRQIRDLGIALSENGSGFAAWQKGDILDDAWEIWGGFLGVTTTPSGDELVISADSEIQRETQPVVTALEDGTFLVTWIKSHYPTKSLWAQKIDQGGNPEGIPYLIADSGDDGILGRLAEGTRAVRTDGSFVVADSVDGDIYIQLFDGGGNLLFEPVLISQDPEYPGFLDSKISVSSNGSFVVSWKASLDAPQPERLFAQVFDQNSAPLSAVFAIDPENPERRIFEYNIALLQDGNVLCAFETSYSDDVHLKAFTNNGEQLGDEISLTGLEYTRQMQIALATDGIVSSLGWKGNSGANNFLRGAILSATGEPLVEPFELDVLRDPRTRYELRISQNNQGKIFAAWLAADPNQNESVLGRVLVLEK